MSSYHPNPSVRINLDKQQRQTMRNFHREKNALKRGRAVLNKNLTNNAVKGLLKLKKHKTRKAMRRR